MSAAGAAYPARDVGARGPLAPTGGTLAQRVRAGLLAAVAVVLQRLPEPPLHRLAQAAGLLLYLTARRRRALVRANLGRICGHLSATGAATPVVAEAARDGASLERLVRRAFGHYARYYLEVMLAPGHDPGSLERRVRVETPELLREAFRARGEGEPGTIIIGLHFGGIELPARYAVTLAGGMVAPMETLADAPLQRWVERSRGATGVTVVPLDGETRRTLAAAVALGRTVGLVGDRDLRGTGLPVTFFGAPTTLPVGPALLAIQTRAPLYVAAARRTGWGRYSARLVRLETPAAGRLRDRAQAIVEQQARAFERIVAEAPEQWLTIFFPVWPDAAEAAWLSCTEGT